MLKKGLCQALQPQQEAWLKPSSLAWAQGGFLGIADTGAVRSASLPPSMAVLRATGSSRICVLLYHRFELS